jgi:hypothetical protein
MGELDEALMSNPEFLEAVERLKKLKEGIFALAMELETSAEDLGHPVKDEVLEVSAIIDEQLDVLEAIVNKYQGDNDND